MLDRCRSWRSQAASSGPLQPTLPGLAMMAGRGRLDVVAQSDVFQCLRVGGKLIADSSCEVCHSVGSCVPA